MGYEPIKIAAREAAAELVSMRDEINGCIAVLSRIGEMKFHSPEREQDAVGNLQNLSIKLRNQRAHEWDVTRLSKTLSGFERRIREAAEQMEGEKNGA